MSTPEPFPGGLPQVTQGETVPTGRERDPGPAWLLDGHIWLVATLVPLLVRVLPLKLLLRLFTPPAGFTPYRGVAPDTIAGRVVLRLRQPRLMRRRACLRQGLTLFHFLRLAGAPAVLRIGVFPPLSQGQRMHAHCWVTLQEVCLSPPPEVPAATLLVWGETPEAS